MHGGEKKYKRYLQLPHLSQLEPSRLKGKMCHAQRMLRVHRVIVSSHAAFIVQTVARRLTDRRDDADDADREQDTTTKATLQGAYQGANDQEDDASDLERDNSYFIVPSWAWPYTQACIRSLIEVACFH